MASPKVRSPALRRDRELLDVLEEMGTDLFYFIFHHNQRGAGLTQPPRASYRVSGCAAGSEMSQFEQQGAALFTATGV